MDPILSVDALASLVREGLPLVKVDARRAHASYLASRLAGASWVDLEVDLAHPAPDASQGGRHPLPSPEAFARTLARLGIDTDSRVVVYDDQAGALAAARLWWMLRACGVAEVQVLDGGWAAITEAAAHGALALESGEPREAQPPSAPSPRPFAWPTVDLEVVERARLDPSWCVLDVRAADRFRGENETIDPVAGHVPGAINVPYASTNLDERGRFLSAELLRARYEAVLGARPLAHTIVHCGSGVTACHTLLALERAGLGGASLYVGSWSEWCRRPGTARAP
ncbi:MAG: sulfurtransferase [Sandaracinaceae bacterium]|nr:sulfurtransferase [Sandaracinaceae bacterium]